MKLLTGALFLTLAISEAKAAEPWELQIPSLQDQYDSVQKEKLDEMVDIAETDEYFAGRIFTVKWKDEIYKVVDRRAEPRRPVTTPPPRDRFMELTQSLGSQAQGKLRLEVKIDRKADGSETETWIFEIDAGWKAESDMKESMGKYHK